MQPERIVLNNLIYGLKRSTVRLYADMVACGFSYEKAMQDLAELYAKNKATANLPIERLRGGNAQA